MLSMFLCSINSRSCSLTGTRRIIGLVLFAIVSLFSVYRGFGTLPQKRFADKPQGAGGQNTEVWRHFLCQAHDKNILEIY